MQPPGDQTGSRVLIAEQNFLVSVVGVLLILAPALLPRACVAREPAPDAASIARRVQQLEDREAIRELLIDYGRTLDARDMGAFARLFTPDGEWIGGFGRLQGRAAIQAEMEQRIGTEPQVPGKSNHHLFLNETIELDGDEARARSKWVFVMTGEDNRPAMVYLGHYEDTLVRTGAGWRFKRRVVYGDIPYDNPLGDD